MDSLKNSIKEIVFKIVFVSMLLVFVLIIFNYRRNTEWLNLKFDTSINDKYYPNVYPDRAKFNYLKRGDLITFKRKMKKKDCNEKYLVFKTYNSSVNVFWNGKKIYSYGDDLYNDDKFIGRGYHIIKLNKVKTSHPLLTVQLRAGENMHYKWMEFFKFTTSNTIWSDILDLNLTSVSISIALLIVGMIGFICFSIVGILLKKSNDHLLFSFSMVFFVGLWSACTNGVFQKMTGNMELTAFLEYIAIYSIPYFYISLIELIKNKLATGKIIFKFKYFYLLFLVTALMLHMSNAYHISQLITVYRISVAIVILIIFVISLIGYSKQRSYEKVLSIGNIASVSLIGVRTLLYNFDINYIRIFGKNYSLGDLFIVLPILIVVITPLISYSLNSQVSKDYETQISLLQNLAYQDSLTGLYNRHKGMAFAIELKKNANQYSIIMMDLNNLKVINDTFGHERGDKLLVDFSNCLKKTFDSEDFLNIRQGGDEFVVVSRFVDENIINEYLNKLHKNIEDTNKEINDGCNISVAYGVAKSYEVGNENYDSVLQLADTRMYSNKEKMKAKMKGKIERR